MVIFEPNPSYAGNLYAIIFKSIILILMFYILSSLPFNMVHSLFYHPWIQEFSGADSIHPFVQFFLFLKFKLNQ